MGVHKPGVKAFVPFAIVTLAIGLGLGVTSMLSMKGFIRDGRLDDALEQVASCEERYSGALEDVQRTLDRRIESHGECQRSYQELRSECGDIESRTAYQQDEILSCHSALLSLEADLDYCNTELAVCVLGPESEESAAHAQNALRTCQAELAALNDELARATHPRRAYDSVLLHQDGHRLRFTYCVDPDSDGEECFLTHVEATNSARATALSGEPLDQRFVYELRSEGSLYSQHVRGGPLYNRHVHRLYEGDSDNGDP